MAESLVQVTEGVGKKLHTWSRVVGANIIEDEFNVPGEFPYPSYTVDVDAISMANAGDDIVQIMAGAALNCRIRSIDIRQAAAATAVAVRTLTIARITSAGTGGAVVTPSKMSNADGAYSGAAASLVPNATHGTIGAVIRTVRFALFQALSATQAQVPDTFHWEQKPGMEPIIIPAGVANGLVIRNATATAGALLTVTIELVETAFV